MEILKAMMLALLLMGTYASLMLGVLSCKDSCTIKDVKSAAWRMFMLCIFWGVFYYLN